MRNDSGGCMTEAGREKGQKFVSWNVNGLRAVQEKGFADVFRSLDADFFCLQETKLQQGQTDLSFPGYHDFWNYAQRKGYSGTAIFARQEPLDVRYGMGVAEHDTEGRLITLEYPQFFLVCAYVPNAQEGLKRLDYRLRWEADFRRYLLSLPRPVVLCGDLNVAHEPIDLKNPSANHHNAGFSDEERACLSSLLAAGFVDTWRSQHPGEAKYSWWSYRFRARERDAGWRIDYFLVSEALRGAVMETDILSSVTGSDHCPVTLTLKP